MSNKISWLGVNIELDEFKEISWLGVNIELDEFKEISWLGVNIELDEFKEIQYNTLSIQKIVKLIFNIAKQDFLSYASPGPFVSQLAKRFKCKKSRVKWADMVKDLRRYNTSQLLEILHIIEEIFRKKCLHIEVSELQSLIDRRADLQRIVRVSKAAVDEQYLQLQTMVLRGQDSLDWLYSAVVKFFVHDYPFEAAELEPNVLIRPTLDTFYPILIAMRLDEISQRFPENSKQSKNQFAKLAIQLLHNPEVVENSLVEQSLLQQIPDYDLDPVPNLSYKLLSTVFRYNKLKDEVEKLNVYELCYTLVLEELTKITNSDLAHLEIGFASCTKKINHNDKVRRILLTNYGYEHRQIFDRAVCAIVQQLLLKIAYGECKEIEQIFDIE